jgi:hypothetical protein
VKSEETRIVIGSGLRSRRTIGLESHRISDLSRLRDSRDKGWEFDIETHEVERSEKR